ncbi:serine hydrolase domain-containing protein [Deinococcus aquiradiocola]|uniref:Esterase n=1 Tax=Deinococcus aquiradiocola TaxID=393059 RepID=A0A917UNG7_9DEIO|nr:serine hydrolase domain-containing protein [Deinococcus aquiradiocola]GGJ70363.1 esterase [Deinococcus aquiradiocola]
MKGAAFTAAADLVRTAVHSGQVPGAALGLLRAGQAPVTAVYGAAQLDPARVPLTPDLTFDLASLTKVLFTLPEVLKLVQDGLADLDDPLSRHLPDMAWMGAPAVAAVTLRQCLTHTSGLPAHAPLYTWASAPETLRARVLQEPWPLGAHVYSDIGFMLLGQVLERVRGRPLRDFPLPAGLTFRPEADGSVATERCAWRGRVLRGEVHDENASAQGGVAGHAGLFGTLHGVLDAARALLDGTALTPAALAELRAPQTPTRALGWERRFPGWSGGSLCSPGTLGHTGFTGTGCWIDFERGYAWTLLTNNVHPSRHTARPLQPLRRAVGNVLAAGWQPG